MNDLICISSIVIAIKLNDRTPNSWMWITKSITCGQLLTGTIWSINAKPRSHDKFGLFWLDCDSQIRTKLANLWGIFDRILKNHLFYAQSFWFKKESFWFQKSSPWCNQVISYKTEPLLWLLGSHTFCTMWVGNEIQLVSWRSHEDLEECFILCVALPREWRGHQLWNKDTLMNARDLSFCV
jgi:hypothetical protein